MNHIDMRRYCMYVRINWIVSRYLSEESIDEVIGFGEVSRTYSSVHVQSWAVRNIYLRL